MPVSSSRPSPGATLVPATDLPPLARQLLADGDLDGYHGMCASIAAIDDRHRRLWAALRLAEIGLAVSAEVPPPARPALLRPLAAALIEQLERDPGEPQLLARGGAVLAVLDVADGAEALLQAAARLDPQLEEVDERLAALSGGRRLLSTGRRSAAADQRLAELASRARLVAERARPAQNMRLSLCMIVRDEEEMLPRCLAAVAPAVDEIVVVDTGSLDATIAIARSFGARVIEHEWRGSFAEARNVSFAAATGDWLLYLDADEVLVASDAALLRSLTGRTWREAFYLSETNHTGQLDDGTAVTHNALRMFRNRPEYRFEGRLHEQIAQTLPGYLPERIEATAVRIEHYGYLGAVSDGREKSRRNIELLQLQQAETPETPFLHYNLGSEYAAVGDLAAALVEFERSWQLLEGRGDRDRYEFAPALLRRLVSTLRLSGRPQDALARAEAGLERYPGFTDLVLEQGLAFQALGDQPLAAERYEQCIAMGEARGYTSRVGSGTYLPMIQLAELRREQGQLAAAIELLERCLGAHPQFLGAVLPYAGALLADGRTPVAVTAELERRLTDPSPTARFMLGTALFEGGASAAGEAQFRAVLARQPHSTRARVALGESLLAQRRYSEAATAAFAVSTEDPLAPLACRTELFARIVGADWVGVEAALQRARLAGMSAPELDLFAAWRELATLGAASSTIAVDEAVVGLLGTMLEALLRVQDFDAFETLLALLGRAPLADAERRDLLAEMYLRRGFAASAAREWMAICRTGPDTRALIGLARVAVVRGMTREADVFAGAALARDPGNEAAAQLLGQAQGE